MCDRLVLQFFRAVPVGRNSRNYLLVHHESTLIDTTLLMVVCMQSVRREKVAEFDVVRVSPDARSCHHVLCLRPRIRKQGNHAYLIVGKPFAPEYEHISSEIVTHECPLFLSISSCTPTEVGSYASVQEKSQGAKVVVVTADLRI
jgi:hypothetical protein